MKQWLFFLVRFVDKSLEIADLNTRNTLVVLRGSKQRKTFVCQFIDAKDDACTALVTRSLHELRIGDRVEMRPAAGSGGN